MKTEVLHYDDLFFWFGCFDKPENPDGLPSQFPFTLKLDSSLGLLSQKDSNALREVMHKTYQYGSTVGNAMDETALGKAYCDDFLKFCTTYLSKKKKILEIGAGRGYMASILKAQGYDIDALEPGEINKPYWKKFGVEIIQDLFPSEKAKGPYDVIIFYGVLEHIANSQEFLSSVKSHLTDNGVVLLSVPDCELEIMGGDPSMLLHEHYQYFSNKSLARCAAKNQFEADVKKSDYGRCLYAALTPNAKIEYHKPSQSELAILQSYGEKVLQQKIKIQQKIEKTEDLGIYIPARILALLPIHMPNIRFFDDSDDVHNKFYPPFPVAVENREDLFNKPPKNLWVMSKTFGHKIKQEILEHNKNINILLPDEIF